MTCMTLRKMVVTYWDLCVRATYCKVCESNLWSVPRSWPAWSLWRQGGIKLFLEPDFYSCKSIWWHQSHLNLFLEPNFYSCKSTWWHPSQSNFSGAGFWLKSEQPDRVSVLNVATKSNGNLDTILGSAYVPDPEHPGELLVQFPGSECFFWWIWAANWSECFFS